MSVALEVAEYIVQGSFEEVNKKNHHNYLGENHQNLLNLFRHQTTHSVDLNMDAVTGGIGQAQIADPHIAVPADFFAPRKTSTKNLAAENLTKNNKQHREKGDHSHESLKVDIQPADHFFHVFISPYLPKSGRTNIAIRPDFKRAQATDYCAAGRALSTRDIYSS